MTPRVRSATQVCSALRRRGAVLSRKTAGTCGALHAGMKSFLIAASVLLPACFDVVRVSRPLDGQSLAQVKAAIEGRDATVLLANGEERAAARVAVDAEQSAWLQRPVPPQRGWVPASAPTASLRSITVVNAGRGAGEGLMLGLLGGLAAGGIVIAATPCGTSLEDLFCPEGRTVKGIATVVVSAGLGAMIGAIAGHRTTIEIAEPR